MNIPLFIIILIPFFLLGWYWRDIKNEFRSFRCHITGKCHMCAGEEDYRNMQILCKEHFSANPLIQFLASKQRRKKN